MGLASYKNKLIGSHASLLEVYDTLETTLLEPSNRVLGFETVTKDQVLTTLKP